MIVPVALITRICIFSPLSHSTVRGLNLELGHQSFDCPSESDQCFIFAADFQLIRDARDSNVKNNGVGFVLLDSS